MKLLLDANISVKLVDRLADQYPASSHVVLLGLERAGDRAVWDYAIEHHYVLVSKDEDFHQMALVEGPPPKVVWVRLGNCSTADIEQIILDRVDDLAAFVADDLASFMVLEQ